MSSLTARMALAFALVVGLTALTFGVAGFVTAEREVTGQVDDFLRDRADDIVRGQRPRPERRKEGNNESGETAEAIARAVDADSIVQLIDQSGSNIISTDFALPVSGADLDIAASGTSGTALRTIDTEQGELRMITAGFPEGGAVQVARFLGESNSVVSSLQSRLLLITVGASVVAAALGAWLSRRITGPIRSLATTVDTVAATQDFTTPIDTSGSDEVGRLAAGFDNLLRSLSASRRQQNQLVQDVAHELRTPLTSIRANVDLLSAAPDLEQAERSQMMDSLKIELRELTHLVNEVVEVAGHTGADAEHAPVDLAELAQAAAERFRLRTGRTVTVTASPTMVRADRERLLRAVANLLSNADKYSAADTDITVTVPGDGWLHVADRGAGISPEDRQQIFDRFYRADHARAEPGTGLGLAIVKSIIDDHHGQVDVGDNPEGGTVVSVYVPTVA